MFWRLSRVPDGTLPDQDFRSSESFVDCAGVHRHFELEVRHLPNHGYAAETHEVTPSEHGGCVFKAFPEASGPMALARLRLQGSAFFRRATPCRPGTERQLSVGASAAPALVVPAR